MPARSIKEVTRALQAQFAGSKPLTSLPKDTRRLLKQFVDEVEDNAEDEDASSANDELKSFWEKYVEKRKQNIGAFAGVLRELRPVMDEDDILKWWQRVIRPVISGVTYPKAVLEDAREFVVGFMVSDEDGEESSTHASTTEQLCRDLVASYTSFSQPSTGQIDEQSVAQNVQISQQFEDVLVAFGRKRPKPLFHHLDDFIKSSKTRFSALTLLSSFLRHQTPHLYLVINTPLIEDLLKCLTNDTSTAILSVGLTSLIMLLPHIPGSLGPHLPRLFLVYSRLLCWEKFSPFSTEAQRNLVTDERVAYVDDDDDEKQEGIGIDDNWERAGPEDDAEVATPELLLYFTYLYGLYPLNLMSYIRKPRRYLKDINFPGAETFDLDQAVIRSRTEQFRQVHLVHPNFYNLTIEEELSDPKWPNLDPADVVGDCHALYVVNKAPPGSPGPPPAGKLPDLPSFPPLDAVNRAAMSPAQSHVSLQSVASWRNAPSTAASVVATDAESPILKPQILPEPIQDTDFVKVPQQPGISSLAYLQRQITMVRNELNFERWHKAQYSTYIGQIMRRNVKEATAEAETLNLIHANRALKKQLDQMRQDREATLKDSALTRKQANSLENNLTEKFNKFKSEQETWQADADELQRLRSEIGKYRELLVASEARELQKSHQLQLVQQDLEDMAKLQSQVKQAQRKIHEYQAREFDFDKTKQENSLVHNENAGLRKRLQRFEQEHAQLRSAFASKLNELEFQLGLPDSPSRYSNGHGSSGAQVATHQALSESQAKLVQLKKSYARLLEKHTDLELEYQAVKSRLEDLLGGRGVGTFSPVADDFDIVDDYAASEAGFTNISASDPSGRRFQPAPSSSSGKNRASFILESDPGRRNSTASSSKPAAFNQSAPLTQDESISTFSDYSESDSQAKKDKIQADSTVRVYGRGGAQNIKLKQKEAQRADDKKKPSGLKGLRNFM